MADDTRPTPEQRPAARRRVRDLNPINEDGRQFWSRTIDRQQKIRQMLRHELRAPLPKLFVDQGAAYFQVDGERKYKRSKDVIASFSKRWPDLVRHHPMGTGPASNSTKIEQGVTAIMRSNQRGVGWPKEAVVDCLTNEGAGCIITQPALSHWQNLPRGMRGADNEIVEQYRRDKNDRAEDDDYYTSNRRRTFKLDKDASRKAFDDHVKWLKARAIPIVQRNISIEQGLPFFGSTGRLEAFIVASQYAVPALVREKLTWFDEDKQIMMGFGGATGYGVTTEQPTATMKTVLEYWSYGCDKDPEHPCVEYQIEKCDTWRAGPKGETLDPVVCFGCEYGMTRLPIAWQPAQGWPGSANPDDWCVGLPWDYLNNDLVQDQVATGLAVAFWRVGFPTFHAKPDAQALALPEANAETDEPEPLVIEPLTLIRSNDTITQIAGAEPSDGGMQLLAWLDGSSERERPNATGGGGGDSALAQATAARFGKDELAHIENAVLALYAESASFVAEIAACIGKKVQPIAIFEQVETPVATVGGQPKTHLKPLTIDPKWFGNPPVYDFDAKLPVRPGDNLALAQQLADFHDRAIVDLAFVLVEGLGLTDPENMIFKVEAEKLRNEPAGRAQILAMVAQKLGDREQAEQAKLQAAQLLSEALGLPPAMGAGLPPASPEAMAAMAMQQQAPGGAGMGMGMDPAAAPQGFQGGGMVGMAQPNPAASQLAGAVGGALGSSAMANSAALGAPIPMGPGGV